MVYFGGCNMREILLPNMKIKHEQNATPYYLLLHINMNFM